MRVPEPSSAPLQVGQDARILLWHGGAHSWISESWKIRENQGKSGKIRENGSSLRAHQAQLFPKATITCVPKCHIHTS